jgi:hypothetical protein
MAEKQKGSLLALSFLVGGLVGGGLALIFAPQLMKARKTISKSADKAMRTITGKREETDRGTYYGDEDPYRPVLPDDDDMYPDERQAT